MTAFASASRSLRAGASLLIAATLLTSSPLAAAAEYEADGGKAAALESAQSRRILNVLRAERSAFKALETDRTFARTGRLPLGPDRLATGSIASPNLSSLGEEDALAKALADATRDMDVEEVLYSHNSSVDSIGDGVDVEAWQCLTEALYFEARGESTRGQFAVAEVILNRVDSRYFPGSVCKVVLQGTGKKYACQFSYACDGKKEVVSERSAFIKAAKVAKVMLSGRPRVLTDRATHYHTNQVNPRWSSKLTETARIGDHIFYRIPTKLSEAN